MKDPHEWKDILSSLILRLKMEINIPQIDTQIHCNLINIHTFCFQIWRADLKYLYEKIKNPKESERL